MILAYVVLVVATKELPVEWKTKQKLGRDDKMRGQRLKLAKQQRLQIIDPSKCHVWSYFITLIRKTDKTMSGYSLFRSVFHCLLIFFSFLDTNSRDSGMLTSAWPSVPVSLREVSLPAPSRAVSWIPPCPWATGQLIRHKLRKQKWGGSPSSSGWRHRYIYDVVNCHRFWFLHIFLTV